MENKYYTPDIEEFYEGFEYEFYSEFMQTYLKTMFTHYNIVNLGDLFKINSPTIQWIKDNKVRVKYLNKEDIEDLGFKYDGIGLFNNKSRTIELYNTYDNLWIISELGLGYKNKLFEGIIKNKSELKKLMKQLLIIE